jgi:hypothetical protein
LVLVTSEHFRKIALGLQGAIESAHMGHPDFRVNGKIFATLYPDGHTGMVKLTPEQQAEFVRTYRETFAPASGAWGRQGCTSVVLRSADETTLGEAITLAWQNTVAKRPARDRGARSIRGTRPARAVRRLKP